MCELLNFHRTLVKDSQFAINITVIWERNKWYKVVTKPQNFIRITIGYHVTFKQHLFPLQLWWCVNCSTYERCSYQQRIHSCNNQENQLAIHMKSPLWKVFLAVHELQSISGPSKANRKWSGHRLRSGWWTGCSGTVRSTGNILNLFLSSRSRSCFRTVASR